MSRSSKVASIHRRRLDRFAAVGGTAILLSSMLMVVGASVALALDPGARTATVTSGPDQWTTPDKAVVSDNVYGSARGNDVKQGYSGFNLDVPAGSIVDGIKVNVEALSSDAAGCRLEVGLSGDGGATLRTKSIDLTDVKTVYSLGSATDTWGQVWDPTQLSDANFKVQLRSVDPGDSGNTDCNDSNPNDKTGTVSVDAFDVTVTYRTMTAGTANGGLNDKVCSQADFNFVIDMSGSIGAQAPQPSNLQQLKDGINGFVDAFQGGGGDGRYAGVKFNDTTASTLPLTNGYETAAVFQPAIDALDGPAGSTPTATGIATGAGNDTGDRAGVTDVMFVLTDGSPDVPGGNLTLPSTWLTAADAAVAAANAARAGADKYVVEAVYLSTATDPGDTNLPFSDPDGDSAWATSVMNQIGGGSHLDSDFHSFVNDLFAAIDCPPPPPSDLHIDKTANPVGPVDAGSQVGFDISISNSGQGAANGVTIHDALPAGGGLDWSISPAVAGCEISGAVGHQVLDCSFDSLDAGLTKGPIHVVSDTAKGDCGTIDNRASVAATSVDKISAGASVAIVCPSLASLTIDKANDAPLVTLVLPDGTSTKLPTAKEGSTVSYSLTYHVSDTSVTAGVISDHLPAGLQYVAGSATSNAEFTFDGYDATTRILSWTAAKVSVGGALGYKALVLDGANALVQPLTNVATIDSAQTEPATAHSDIYVPVPPKAETSKPTAPPTEALAATDATSGPGSSLLLLLAGFGLLVLSLIIVNPVPARVRRRNQR
jgi:uncharacterized repeat protein (TIGR01451 family)